MTLTRLLLRAIGMLIGTVAILAVFGELRVGPFAQLLAALFVLFVAMDAVAYWRGLNSRLAKPFPQIELTVIAALSAAAKDPCAGRVRVKRGWFADVQETEVGRQLFLQRGDERAILTRRAAAPQPGTDYPSQIPFVPNATVWWAVTGPLAATWVNIDSPDELAATLTSRFIADGWSAESALLMKRAKIAFLTRNGLKRTIIWTSRQVQLYDRPVQSSPDEHDTPAMRTRPAERGSSAY